MLDQDLINKIKNTIKTKDKVFVPGISNVPVSGKIFDEKELEYMIEAVLDCHWTEGRWNDMFENKMQEFLGIKNVITTNSGSSANLLAFTTLCAKELGDKQVKPGDEVVTTAAGFPTTINPIIQNGCVPVFVDVDLETYEVNIEELKKAISPKTKVIMMAHTLGNTFNLGEITKICKENNLWLIEDACDALGAKFNSQYVGTFGDIATLSFYPAHHITMGEGGALMTNNNLLAKIIRSYRDWGRDCFCKTGEDNSCKNRYNWQLGQLPKGFDHKYTYSRIGYNLKITDIQAALGLAQLKKLEGFIAKRKENFNYLKEKFEENGLEKYFILPKETPNSEASWFGFVLSLKEGLNFSRENLLEYLNENKIGTRLLFVGNYLKQPAFLDYVKDYRVIGDLKNTDYIMNNTFWIGVFPGLSKGHLDYIILKFKEFLNGK
ncbi:MAG: lipopolysaccharide biosynthesis protein RfbH [Candidatus Gracilibacteria bacterium]|nr:lipopolysaccharide biosynthesis protein RfbH [Candidatus Gracilibacteria bacterium]